MKTKDIKPMLRRRFKAAMKLAMEMDEVFLTHQFHWAEGNRIGHQDGEEESKRNWEEKFHYLLENNWFQCNDLVSQLERKAAERFQRELHYISKY